MTEQEYKAIHSKSSEEAYAALLDSYADYVYTIVFNRLRSVASREDIEECVSDIFADIFLYYRGNNDSMNDMKGYISTVAKRRAINTFHSLTARAGHFSDKSDTDLAQMSTGADIEANSDAEETRTILIEKINELGEPDSTIIIHKYYYDRTSEEIAKMLSMKASAVRMRASRALDKLRTSLSAVGITMKGDE